MYVDFYKTGAEHQAVHRAMFGQGSSSYPIHIEQARCTGGERNLTGCPHGSSTCSHSEDAGVRCCKMKFLYSRYPTGTHVPVVHKKWSCPLQILGLTINVVGNTKSHKKKQTHTHAISR